MPKLTRRPPAYSLHSASGQAVVRLAGKDHYLGEHGSPASRAAYARFLAEWETAGGQAPIPAPDANLTIDQLAAGYWTGHVEVHYRKDDAPTTEQNAIRLALRPLLRLFGTTAARDFGPRNLRAVRDAMVQDGLVRTSINRHCGRIRHLFKWGASQEYIPAVVWQSLATLDGLRRGRSAAAEGEPVGPAPDAHIQAVLPLVSRQVAGMIRLQLLTGMRPGEVLTMRGCDLDATGKVWTYTPSRHKCQHFEKPRRIFVGPLGQAILRDFLKPDLTAFLFDPQDAKREKNALRRQARRTPLWPSHQQAALARKRKRAQAPTVSKPYREDALRRAVQRACEKAGVPVWTPNQLRHSAATRLRKDYGLDLARAALGHSTVTTTQIYAEQDEDRLRLVMEKIG